MSIFMARNAFVFSVCTKIQLQKQTSFLLALKSILSHLSTTTKNSTNSGRVWNNGKVSLKFHQCISSIGWTLESVGTVDASEIRQGHQLRER